MDPYGDYSHGMPSSMFEQAGRQDEVCLYAAAKVSEQQLLALSMLSSTYTSLLLSR